MRRVAEGDAIAFAVLYQRHCLSALRLAVQICARQAIAEEVVQEAFLALWRNRCRYDRRRGSLRAWLLWLVRNRAIDAVRQAIVQDRYGAHALSGAAVAIDALDDPETPDAQAGRREDARRVRAALEELPAEQRTVVALAYYGGYTHAEIASLLDTPLGTVKGRMRLGLRKMEQSLLAAA